MKKRLLAAFLTVLMIFSVLPVYAANYQNGDVDQNGDVSSSDARTALRAAVGLEKLSDEQKKLADVNGDGELNSSDARSILRAAVGLEKLPVLHTHSYTDEKIIKEPTCTEKGIKRIYCECGEVYKEEEIPAKGHTEEIIPAVSATCTTTGLTEGRKCSVCGEILVAQKTVGMISHSKAEREENRQDASCTANGSYDKVTYCTVCGKELSREKISVPAKGHAWGEWTVKTPANCEDKGLEERVCGNDSSHTETREIPALGGEHQFTTLTVPPTCTEEGYTAEKCEKCGFIKNKRDFVEKLTHIPVLQAERKPTCETDGYREHYECSLCNKLFKDEKCTVETTAEAEKIPALGGRHNLKTFEIPATCAMNAYKIDKCQNPGCPYKTNRVDLKGEGYDRISHNFVVVERTEPTCEEEGQIKKACTLKVYDHEENIVPCSAVDIEVLAPLGHDYKWTTVKKATCTETGSRHGVCTRCGKETDEVIPLKLHRPAHVLYPGNCLKGTQDVEKFECTVCKKQFAEPVIKGDGHDMKLDPSRIVRPTCTAEGTNYYKCSRCGAEKQEKIKMIPHDIEKTVKNPTCTEDGYIRFSGTCSMCNEVFDGTEIVLPASHKWNRTEPSCTEAVVCTVCGEVKEKALGHDNLIAGSPLGTDVHGFYCPRCKRTLTDADTFNNVVNKIKGTSFNEGYTVTSFGKTKTDTYYNRFDFGSFTSQIKDIYDENMADTPDEFRPLLKNKTIIFNMPLRYPVNGKYKVSALTDKDINKISIERFNNIKFRNELKGFTDMNGKDDISGYLNRTYNKDVLKVTVDVRDEYYKFTNEGGSSADGNVIKLPLSQDTSLQKIYDYDIRNDAISYTPVDTDGDGKKDKLIMKEEENGQGFAISMTMELLRIDSDAKVTFYLDAEDYTPILAKYDVKIVYKQGIDMSFRIGIFALDGVIDPVITTAFSNVYIFEKK